MSLMRKLNLKWDKYIIYRDRKSEVQIETKKSSDYINDIKLSEKTPKLGEFDFD